MCQLYCQFGLHSAQVFSFSFFFVASTDTLRFELILFTTVNVLFDRVYVTAKSCQY